MTRKDIENKYTTKNGIITSPGKFQGEPIYAPAFFAAWLDGSGEEQDDDTTLFYVEPEDVAEFPELAGVRAVKVWEDGQGFVYVGPVD